MFKQKDVRILRETLAKLARMNARAIAEPANKALLQFAQAIAEYCPHEEQTLVAAENMNACLDCGKRFVP